MVKKLLKTFAGGLLAGIAIAIGGTVFLSVENKIIGSLFFTIGLFSVCVFGMNLYTGKICYIFDNDKKYALMLPVIWLGNLAGTLAVAGLERLTRIGANLQERAKVLCETKLNDSVWSILILSIFCDMLIYIAVEGFKNIPHEVGKYLALFFGVAVFILCGFEHCVANMYYFSVAGMWSWKTLLYVFIMTLGNSVGGVILPLLRMAATEKKQ